MNRSNFQKLHGKWTLWKTFAKISSFSAPIYAYHLTPFSMNFLVSILVRWINKNTQPMGLLGIISFGGNAQHLIGYQQVLATMIICYYYYIVIYGSGVLMIYVLVKIHIGTWKCLHFRYLQEITLKESTNPQVGNLLRTLMCNGLTYSWTSALFSMFSF